MFGSENRVAVKHEGFADCFFLRELLFSQSESFGAITRPSERRDRFVECKHTHCLGGSLFSVFQSTLMIAGLNVVMGQLLNCARGRFAAAFQTLGNVTMEPPSSDRIQLFVKNLANLVVCETE